MWCHHARSAVWTGSRAPVMGYSTSAVVWCHGLVRSYHTGCRRSLAVLGRLCSGPERELSPGQNLKGLRPAWREGEAFPVLQTGHLEVFQSYILCWKKEKKNNAGIYITWLSRVFRSYIEMALQKISKLSLTKLRLRAKALLGVSLRCPKSPCRWCCN